MSQRLGDKLNAASGAFPPSPAASNAGARTPCFVRASGSVLLCSYGSTEGTVWLFPLSQLATVRSTADGKLIEIAYSGGEVRIEGARLDRVRDALVRGQAFQVHAVSPTFESEYEDEVFVSAVLVTESKLSKSDSVKGGAP